MDALEWISLISGLCSIVGLPLAIWQIFAVKSRVKASEVSINKILYLKDREKLEHIKSTLVEVQDGIRDLQNLDKQVGKSENAINERVTEILKNLDHCRNEIPVDEILLEDSIKSCIGEIQKFREGNMQTTHLEEASDYLYASVYQIKKSLESREKKEIEMAAKG